MEKKNIVWINYLKAICVIAVFQVHCELYYGFDAGVIDYLVHPFYVNSFFFVSGYHMLRKQLSEPLISQDAGEYVVGGGCPRTTDHKSEILQSVSSSDDSCLSYGNNYQLLGGITSNPSSATYNLKVENSQN